MLKDSLMNPVFEIDQKFLVVKWAATLTKHGSPLWILTVINYMYVNYY